MLSDIYACGLVESFAFLVECGWNYQYVQCLGTA